MNELLFEIGTEEIPAGYIGPALRFMESFADRHLADMGLAHGRISTVGTPRRLTLIVADLQGKQKDTKTQHTGPAYKAAYDSEGNPTKAALGFARSKGVDVADLQVVTMKKGDYLMVEEEIPGKFTRELLPDLLLTLIHEIPFPKSMHWARSSLTFARPLQWLLALYDGKVVEMEIEGITAGDQTCGHRFMAPEFFPVQDSADYLQALEKHFVIADPARRKELAVKEVEQAVLEKQAVSRGIAGGSALLDEGLLATVTNLVEIPWGVCGEFDDKFLVLPREALVTSMREHQKYFPVMKDNGDLLPFFVAVNNTKIDDHEMAASGHERVIRARLEDGLFFFNEDKKQRLEDRLDKLSGIIFQQKLGTMEGKSRRMAVLAGKLAQLLDPAVKEQAIRAARLAKADLLTEMVGEFPSLQGVIGSEYARLDGEPEEVAVAIAEHYMPVRAGSELPQTLVGAIVGIADRLDTLAGCFAIGEKPTGNKDSFGLRRQAIGLINIIRGLDLSLSLTDMLTYALAGYDGVIETDAGVVAEVVTFIRLRFENELFAGGYDQDVIKAATSVDFDDLRDCLLRIEALKNIRSREAFVVLSGSFKRIRNITRENMATDVDEDLLSEQAEKELYEVVERVRNDAQPLIDEQEYVRALEVLLQMKEPVDRFFDEVMVMADDERVRVNRLNLLTVLRELVLRIGDISRMHADE
ncbi:MAG TPA: glycine--tRNA ligase subunit beta [Desulfobulbus sp.]|nr:glycine--tRNA ligase subunit beta [Desulfobulbus sp.]